MKNNTPEILELPPPQPASALITGKRQHAIAYVLSVSINNPQSNDQSHWIVHLCQHSKLTKTQNKINILIILIISSCFILF